MPPQLPTCQSETYSGPDEPTGAYIYYRRAHAPTSRYMWVRAYLWVIAIGYLTGRLMRAIYH
jgi:hypothetical protein